MQAAEGLAWIRIKVVRVLGNLSEDCDSVGVM